MMQYLMQRGRAAAAALGCSLLLACGGGADTAPAAADPPAAATAPVASPVAPAPVTPAASPVLPAQVPPGYALVWADEFDTPGLPGAKRWGYDTERNALGWYNNERQYYAAARAENAVVSGGRLKISARAETLSSAADWGGQRYTSARLTTRGLAEWTYGFFEVRAKLPCGRGTWPAIWMLGSTGPWPVAGEIDIMEHVGSNPRRVFGTVHTQVSAGPGTGGARQVTDACTAFHDYQLHWTADELAIGIDGVVYYRYPNPRAGRATWPFDAPQYLLLNIAIGGTLGGAVDDAIFPVTMEIEHVRVYQARP
jgi:beta-glucanase (GH16 family)